MSSFKKTDGRYHVTLDSPWDAEEVIDRLKRQMDDEEELEARRLAAKLAAYMGDGWRPSVGQVYGLSYKWTWSARRGDVWVSPDRLHPIKHELEKLSAPFGFYFRAKLGMHVWSSVLNGPATPTHWDPKEALRLARQHCLAGLQARIDLLHDTQSFINDWAEDGKSYEPAPLPQPTPDLTKIAIP